MQILVELGQIILSAFFFVFLMPVFWLVVFLVYSQYKRAAALERRLFGRVINPVGRQMISSTALGILGGLVAGLLLVFFGLTLQQIGIYFILPVALLLLLVHPRFLCFSYAGGLVALASLLMRALVDLYPALGDFKMVEALLGIHIPALLALVGLLHLVEALLIYVSGHRGCSPLYFKKPGEGVVGGFSLQRFWPLPLVVLLVTVVLQRESVGVSMPAWWPLIKSAVQPGPGETLQYLIIPAVAGLGYADLAISSTPREKSLFSARYLAIYSAALLLVALAAEHFPLFTLPGILLAPLGHELLVVYGNRREQQREPRYRWEPPGTRIMMVLPETAASRAGLQEGDVILKVNGLAVSGPQDLLKGIQESYFMVLLEGIRNGETFTAVLKKNYQGEESRALSDVPPHYASVYRGAALGLILVPSPRSAVYVESRRAAPLSSLRRIFGGKSSRQ